MIVTALRLRVAQINASAVPAARTKWAASKNASPAERKNRVSISCFNRVLSADLRGSESAAFGPERLTGFAGSGNCGTVRAVFTAANVAEEAGAVAADAVGGGCRSHFGCWLVVADGG